jgi:endonuclease/exonuclease/phosphatase family metal-dependent hydrolase
MNKAKQAIRVVSYNVHSGKNTKEIAEVFTHDKILKTADIIFFQEIEFHQAEKICRAEAIARHLGFYFTYEAARTLNSGATHGLAILSRFELKNPLSIRLPKHKLLFVTHTRIALMAEVTINNQKVAICNIHLDTRLNPKERVGQLDACVKKLKKTYGKNIIIGGDFNTIPFRSIAKSLPFFYSNQPKHLLKHMLNLGFYFCSKPSTYTMKAGFLRMKLDYIFSDNLPITKSGVEKHIYASDHKPVWADVFLAEG